MKTINSAIFELIRRLIESMKIYQNSMVEAFNRSDWTHVDTQAINIIRTAKEISAVYDVYLRLRNILEEKQEEGSE